MNKSLQLIILGVLFSTTIGNAQWIKIRGTVITEKSTIARNDKIEVMDNILKKYMEKNINYSTKPFFFVTVPFEKINVLSLSGSGNLESINTIVPTNFKDRLFDTEDLTLNIKTKDFEAVVLTETTDSFNSNFFDSGDVDAIMQNKKRQIQFEYCSFYFDYFKKIYFTRVFSRFQFPVNII